MKTLVIGGAGYIGSTTAHLLAEAGHEVTIIDDLTTGHKSYASDFPLETINITNYEELLAAMQRLAPDVVLHFAAKIQVGESVQKPFDYFENNTYGTMQVLKAMQAAGVKNIVFSSTAAVYGEPEHIPLQEDSTKKPINPYGLSKYLSEQLLESYGQTHDMNWAAFRYFNAAGAYNNKIAMDYPVMTHLIPHATEAVLGNETLKLFGDDYDTDDGTCIRDFVHVVDIAKAHVVAAETMIQGTVLQTAFNLGSGSGYSVRQVIETVEKVSGKPVPYTIEPRRSGDPSILIADVTKAKEVLGWSAELPLEEMVQSHYRWRTESLV